jgi:hypothetical protein
MMPTQQPGNGEFMTEHFQSVPVDDGIKDFSVPRKPIKFKIDGDLFDAYVALPALTLIRFSTLVSEVDNDDEESARKQLTGALQLVLKPDAYPRFVARMENYDNPIDITQVNAVIPWLLEQYGLRPTTPSENSSDGQVNQVNGMNSTVSTSGTVSTYGPSL